MKKKLYFLLTLLLILSFNLNILMISVDKEELLSNPNSVIIEVTNFATFQKIHDSLEIESIKQNQYINFTYNGNFSTIQEWEWFSFSLLEFGNCSDFEIIISVEYNYGKYVLGEFFLQLNSTFNRNGEFPFTSAEKTLCYTSVCDFWHETGGKYKVAAFPHDKWDLYETPYNSPVFNEVVLFNITRKNNNLICSIKANDVLKQEHKWTSGIDKPLNYIQIGCSIYPFTNDTVNISFHDFYGKLNCTGDSVTSPTPSTPPTPPTPPTSEYPYPENKLVWIGALIGITFMLLLFLAIMFLGYKKR